MSAGFDRAADLRRDLRALVMLESLLVTTGIGALLVIAVHTILLEGELEIAAVALLAVTYLLLALRIRCGEQLARRELQRMELRAELDAETMTVATGSHPYRSSARTLRTSPPAVVCSCGAALPSFERSRPPPHATASAH